MARTITQRIIVFTGIQVGFNRANGVDVDILMRKHRAALMLVLDTNMQKSVVISFALANRVIQMFEE